MLSALPGAASHTREAATRPSGREAPRQTLRRWRSHSLSESTKLTRSVWRCHIPNVPTFAFKISTWLIYVQEHNVLRWHLNTKWDEILLNLPNSVNTNQWQMLPCLCWQCCCSARGPVCRGALPPVLLQHGTRGLPHRQGSRSDCHQMCPGDDGLGPGRGHIQPPGRECYRPQRLAGRAKLRGQVTGGVQSQPELLQTQERWRPVRDAKIALVTSQQQQFVRLYFSPVSQLILNIILYFF